jgi:hypothetical protein
VKSKPEMCRDIRAVALIDDNLTYAQQCSRTLEKVLLFDREGEYAWNVHTGPDPLPNNVVRCLSWADIREQLENWQPTGQVDLALEPI